MWKKILSKFFKYVVQIIILFVLIAFLTKTGNMPTVVPKKYIDKIIEYTDRTLIALKLIKDPKIIQKYAEKAKKVKEEKPEQVDKKVEKKISDKEVFAYKEVYEISIFDKIYNFLLLNNYELSILRELNNMGETLNNQLKKLNNIIESSYVRDIIREKELGIKNIESYILASNLISGFKYIEGFHVFNENNKLITSIYTGDKLQLNAKTVIKKLKSSKISFDIYEFKDKTYFLYLISNYQESTVGTAPRGMDVLFLLEPEYFNISINNINIKHFFVFNKNYRILNSNITDNELIEKLEGAIQYETLNFKKNKFRIKFLKLEYINLYTGILFKKYPLVYKLLNVGKLLLFIGMIYLLFLAGRLLYKKLRDFTIKQKPSEIEMVTGAMMELARSMKSAANVKSESAVNIDKRDMEEVVNNVLSKYMLEEQKQDEQERPRYMPVFKRKKKTYNIKEVDGWKIIEYL